jgi:hypothetical protein
MHAHLLYTLQAIALGVWWVSKPRARTTEEKRQQHAVNEHTKVREPAAAGHQTFQAPQQLEAPPLLHTLLAACYQRHLAARLHLLTGSQA